MSLLCRSRGDCGTTPEEALSRGCVLDLIPGAFYSDPEGSAELSLQSIRATGGPSPYYVTKRYHVVHCAYIWLKFHRAVARSLPTDSHVGEYDHSRHCFMSLTMVDNATGLAPLPFGHIFTSCDLAQTCRSSSLSNHCFP
ncbi:hypothetical protein F5Y16DRAFT_413456 [Xylariaceae sp. FL0255]|nr:hypothetical protein F5Y16DRAFT_413456 [Xylariaceae sp. FL0255]